HRLGPRGTSLVPPRRGGCGQQRPQDFPRVVAAAGLVAVRQLVEGAEQQVPQSRVVEGGGRGAARRRFGGLLEVPTLEQVPGLRQGGVAGLQRRREQRWHQRRGEPVVVVELHLPHVLDGELPTARGPLR